MGRLPASLMSAENISCSTTSICAARNDSSSVVSSNTEMTLVAAREVPSSHVFRSNTRSRVFCRKGNSILLWSVSSVGMRPMARRRKTAGAWRERKHGPCTMSKTHTFFETEGYKEVFRRFVSPFPCCRARGKRGGNQSPVASPNTQSVKPIPLTSGPPCLHILCGGLEEVSSSSKRSVLTADHQLSVEGAYREYGRWFRNNSSGQIVWWRRRWC